MPSPNRPLIVYTTDGMSLSIASCGTSSFHVHIVSHVPNLTLYFYTLPLWVLEYMELHSLAMGRGTRPYYSLDFVSNSK